MQPSDILKCPLSTLQEKNIWVDMVAFLKIKGIILCPSPILVSPCDSKSVCEFNSHFEDLETGCGLPSTGQKVRLLIGTAC